MINDWFVYYIIYVKPKQLLGFERIHFYRLSHGAACGRTLFVAQTAKMGAGNY